MGAGAIAVFIGTLLVVESFMPGDPHDQVLPGVHLKCDFIAFYTGGSFVRDGKAADLYDIPKVHAFQTEIARQNHVQIGSAIGPWWNPPFYAWVFAPLARFSYPHALEIWLLVNLACAAISALLLSRIVATSAGNSLSQNGVQSSATSNFSAVLLVPVLMVLSTPFIHALSHGQNTCTSLLLVTAVVLFWRNGKAIGAGLTTGLLFYKPQLGAVLTAVLILNLGWRTLIGLSITGTLLLLASLALPGTLQQFLHQMPNNLHFVQCQVPYLWDRHVTFKAFWRLLLQGMGAGEPTAAVTILSTACSAIVGAGLFWTALRVRKFSATEPGEDVATPGAAARRDRLIAATIAATPLLMPFYFDYDQLLLLISGVLLAADLVGRDASQPLPKTDLWLLRLWPAYYAWLMLNPDIAVRTHVNLSVVLLTGVAALLITRAARRRDTTRGLLTPTLTPFEQRLAAA